MKDDLAKGRFLNLKAKLNKKKKLNNENVYIEKIYKDLNNEFYTQKNQFKSDINSEIDRELNGFFEKLEEIIYN